MKFFKYGGVEVFRFDEVYVYENIIENCFQGSWQCLAPEGILTNGAVIDLYARVSFFYKSSEKEWQATIMADARSTVTW